MQTNTTSSKIWCLLLISCTLIVILILLFGGEEGYFEQSVSGLIDNQKSSAFTSFLVLCSDIVLPVCFVYNYFGSISNSQDAFLISFGISIANSFSLIDRRKKSTYL